ncbi:hypothetical protein L3V83_09015 [Thiotrichales bacterium 19X7-9]|nr:hypothetical protein [Thiotrichales bacterium 19X7-9]
MPRNTGWVQDNFQESIKRLTVGFPEKEYDGLINILNQSADRIKYSLTLPRVYHTTEDEQHTQVMREQLKVIPELDSNSPLSINEAYLTANRDQSLQYYTQLRMSLAKFHQAGNCREIAEDAKLLCNKTELSEMKIVVLYDKQDGNRANHVVLSFSSNNGHNYIFDPQNGHLIENNEEALKNTLKLWDSENDQLIPYDPSKHSMHVLGDSYNRENSYICVVEQESLMKLAQPISEFKTTNGLGISQLQAEIFELEKRDTAEIDEKTERRQLYRDHQCVLFELEKSGDASAEAILDGPGYFGTRYPNAQESAQAQSTINQYKQAIFTKEPKKAPNPFVDALNNTQQNSTTTLDHE